MKHIDEPSQAAQSEWKFIEELRLPEHRVFNWNRTTRQACEADVSGGIRLLSDFPDPSGVLDTAYEDMMTEITACLRASIVRAHEAGVSDKCIAIDPGIGFGKNTAGNLELIRRLPELSGFGLPILTGPSRKSFIGTVLGREQTDDRLFGTAAVVALSVANGASILRVHDVRAMRDVADMAHAVMHS